jgi:hypothetical protein
MLSRTKVLVSPFIEPDGIHYIFNTHDPLDFDCIHYITVNEPHIWVIIQSGTDNIMNKPIDKAYEYIHETY